jgi:hypothetical protein
MPGQIYEVIMAVEELSPGTTVFFLILGAFTELLTVITSFVISVHSSARNNSSQIFMTFHTGNCDENLLRHVSRVEFGYTLSKGPNKLCLDKGYHSKQGV